MKWLGVAALCVAIGGCATTGAPAPQSLNASVQLDRDASLIRGCERLGPIRSNSVLTGVLSSQGYDSLISDLKSKAAAMGGNHVLIFDFTSNYGSNNASGDVYRCPQ